MIESIIRSYLEGALGGVPVFLEMPEIPSDSYEELPDEFVLIERVAGGQTEHIDTASLAVKSYSLSSLYNSAALDRQVRKAMEGFTTLDSVSACRLASNYNFTDTSTKRYRYQSVFDVIYYD